ncbi:hypothetical protein [Candidatus Tisiphia endosymbiont of Beris chalybata]|uniref:hypothetical protein n=1 Tax=Candidatus Tisiphia endosymbiont of Beris chalybata TaxID=3066262 RepID=UPI00312C7BE2
MSKDDQEHYQKLQEFRTEIKQNIEKDPKAAQIKISREIIQRTRALTEFMKPKDKVPDLKAEAQKIGKEVKLMDKVNMDKSKASNTTTASNLKQKFKNFFHR